MDRLLARSAHLQHNKFQKLATRLHSINCHPSHICSLSETSITVFTVTLNDEETSKRMMPLIYQRKTHSTCSLIKCAVYPFIFLNQLMYTIRRLFYRYHAFTSKGLARRTLKQSCGRKRFRCVCESQCRQIANEVF